MKKRLSAFFCLAAMQPILMTGCAVGPDFRPPDFKTPPHFTAAPLPAETAATDTKGGNAQRFAFAEDLSAQWWTLFGSPELDTLVRQGLTNSPSMAAAQAALRKAEENYRAARGALLFPGVDASIYGGRQRTSTYTNGGGDNTFNLYHASVGVSYTLDLFGGSRRRLEALQAQVDYQRFLYEAAYLTLAANIVTTAIREAALRDEIAATHEILKAEEKHLKVVQKQFELGAVARIAVLAQQTELAATKASLPPLEKEHALTRHALSVLVGRTPGEGHVSDFSLDRIVLPENLPVSLPSVLARQRPDIRAAESVLHQACAEVGVATANLYPRVTLSGGYRTEALSTGDLFSSPSIVWNLGAGLLQPLFHGGELTAKRRAAIAGFDEAAAQYRQTVLKGFQDVADVLRSLETDARTLQAQVEAEAAARTTLTLAEKQFRLGAVNYLYLLIAQRNYHRARFSLVAAQATRYADTAALFQALGGGWWNRETDKADATLKKD